MAKAGKIEVEVDVIARGVVPRAALQSFASQVVRGATAGGYSRIEGATETLCGVLVALGCDIVRLAPATMPQWLMETATGEFSKAGASTQSAEQLVVTMMAARIRKAGLEVER